MKMTSKIVTVLALAVMFAVPAVAHKEAPAQTATTINAPAAKVKNALIVAQYGTGFNLVSESPSQIVLSKPLKGAAGMLTTLLSTPQACTDYTPQLLETFTLIETSDSTTTVLFRLEMEHAGPFCRPVRDSINNKKLDKQLAEFMQRIKAQLETTTPQQSATPATPAVAAPVAPAPVAPLKVPDVAALRQQYTDSLAAMLKQMGKPGYAEFSGDTETMHAPQGTKEKFDALVANKDFLAAMDSMQVYKVVYTNDKDLTLVWQRSKQGDLPVPVAVPRTPEVSPATPVTPDKLVADRKTFLDTINAPGRKGHGEIAGDTLTLHTAECNKQNFDLLVANPHMQEIFKNLQIKTFVYTNDLDLTFTQEIK
jgi:hypothetical protein